MPHYNADEICHWKNNEKKIKKQTKPKQQFHGKNYVSKFERT